MSCTCVQPGQKITQSIVNSKAGTDGRPKKCAQCVQCEPPLPALGNEQDSQGGSSAHCSVNSVSPTIPAICSSRAVASASNRMCETAAYQLVNSTQLNVYSPIRKTRDTVIIYQMHGRLPERPKPIYAGHPWL